MRPPEAEVAARHVAAGPHFTIADTHAPAMATALGMLAMADGEEEVRSVHMGALAAG